MEGIYKPNILSIMVQPKKIPNQDPKASDSVRGGGTIFRKTPHIIK